MPKHPTGRAARKVSASGREVEKKRDTLADSGLTEKDAHECEAIAAHFERVLGRAGAVTNMQRDRRLRREFG